MSLFETYKPGQAKTSRTLIFTTGAIFIVWAAKSMVETLPTFWDLLGKAINHAFMGATFEESWKVDLLILRPNVSIALVVAALFLVGVTLWWFRFLNRPTWADLLIDTDAELRKVSWPTFPDAWQSTLIVTGCTVVLVGIILFYDFMISRFMALFSGSA